MAADALVGRCRGNSKIFILYQQLPREFSLRVPSPGKNEKRLLGKLLKTT